MARDAAHGEGIPRITLTHRHVDVPLSDLGREQAAALGRWFASFEPDAQPEILLASPYIRAVQTAKLFGAAGGYDPHEPI